MKKVVWRLSVAELVTLKPEFYDLQYLVENYVWKEPNIEKYQNIAWQIPKYRILFGAWLYTSFTKIEHGNNGQAYNVDPLSIEHSRLPFIKGALSYAYSFHGSDITKATIMFHWGKFFRWMNNTKIKCPANIDEARAVFRDYTQYLKQIVKKHDPRIKAHKHKHESFGQNSATSIQKNVLTLMLHTFEVDKKDTYKIIGTTEIIPQKQEGNKDFMVNEKKVDEALCYYYQFFDQVADFLLEMKSYPHKIFLLEHEVLLVPDAFPIITPYTGTRGDNGRYWELERGILRSLEEVIHFIKQEDKYLLRDRQSGRVQMENDGLQTFQNKLTKLKAANEDPNCHYRRELGLKAMKAYYIILLDVTGMSDSELSRQEWDDDDDAFDIKKDEHLFHTIKRRAGNKKNLFSIQKVFIPSFKKFLRLRRLLLDKNNNIKCLFFRGYGKDAKAVGTYGGTGIEFFASFKNLYPELVFNGSQTLRNNKKKWVIKYTNGHVVLTAKVMQHTPEVGQRSYPHETREESQHMMGIFFDYQNRLVKNVIEDSGTGGCDANGDIPQRDTNKPIVKPDCNNRMTCLFCIYYRAKVNREDIWKLLSMEYVIRNISILHARSKILFDEAMQPILFRVESLLETMKSAYPYSKKLIEEVRHDVYMNRNLHWFWEMKLNMNWELGWV